MVLKFHVQESGVICPQGSSHFIVWSHTKPLPLQAKGSAEAFNSLVKTMGDGHEEGGDDAIPIWLRWVFFASEKYDFVSWDDESSQFLWKKNKPPSSNAECCRPNSVAWGGSSLQPVSRWSVVSENRWFDPVYEHPTPSMPIAFSPTPVLYSP